MAFLAPATGLFGAAGSLIGKVLTGGSKAAQPPITPVVPTRNAAADMARQADLLRRRRGSAANNVTGGAEASTAGAKTLLGG